MFKTEHQFEEYFKVFVVFDTIKNLVTVEQDGTVDELDDFGLVNCKRFSF